MNIHKVAAFSIGLSTFLLCSFMLLCYNFNSYPNKNWSYSKKPFSMELWRKYYLDGGSFNHRYTMCDSLIASIRPHGLSQNQIETSLGREISGALNTTRIAKLKTYFDASQPSQEQSVSAYLVGSEMNVMFGVDKIYLYFVFVDNRCTACFVGGDPA